MAFFGTAGKVGWYARRLTAMSGREISHRVSETLKKRAARRWPTGWQHFAQLEGPLPRYPGEIDLASVDAETIARWQRVTDRAMARRFTFLGLDWPDLAGNSLWHFDPVSKAEWPKKRYCFAINYRHTAKYGDVKYVWEVNRLQYLQPIAALAAKTGKAGLAEFAAKEIESWIDANPPFLGVNWPSGIELALRAITVLIVTRLLGETTFSVVLQEKIRSFLVASAAWLYRYPSKFSSANNHLVAEAAGLFLIGAAYADHGKSGEWQAYGRKVLEEEAMRQILADGIGAEQSPTYTAFTLELFLIALKAAEAMGQPFSGTVYGQLARAGEALSWFMDENGEVPRIGDDDEGRVIFDEPASDRLYVASVLSAVAATCNRPDIAPPVSPGHLRNLIFGGLTGKPRQSGVKVFAEGGYTVLRDRVHDRQLLLAMDHGPLGYLSIAAHGHADALALWLNYDGKPLLSDAGTYLYHSGGAWRDAFRGTPLHNTLSIEGESSSRVAGAFNWASKAEADLISADEGLESFHLDARHNGFARRYKVHHRRMLRRLGTEAFEVIDALEGIAENAIDVAISYLAGEGVEIRPVLEGGGFDFVAGGKPLARLNGPAGFSARLVHGSEKEKLGWISPRFGVKAPAWQLVFSGRLRVGETAMSELVLR